MIFYPDKAQPYQQPGATTLYQLVKNGAAIHPEAIAIAAPERRPLSYGRLLSQVEDTLVALRALGVQRNDRVAVALPNGAEMAVAFVAVAAGATCAPLNPSYRTEEFDFYLSDLKARALVVSSEMESPGRESARRRNIPIIELTPIAEAEAGTFTLTPEHQTWSPSDDRVQPGDTALVLHTSGTTSRPKIVPLSHCNVCSSGHNIALALKLTADDCCLNMMPLFHIHGLVGAVVSSLTAGARVICTPGLDAKRFFGWLDSFQPTWYTAVPTMHQAILAAAPAHRETIARCRLRFVRSASAPMLQSVMAGVEEVFGVPVLDSYGMTEAAHQMTSNPLPPLPRKMGSVGVAAGPEVAIMDEAGNLLPVGEIGEVVIRGKNVTSGYENDQEADRKAFTHGWFRTGDQGRFDADGYLFLTGRLKEIINRGGEKITPKEVDEILTQHPAIAEAVAFSMPHATLGEDVAAAVVLKGNAVVTEMEIRDFAAARLADFKVPRRVLIVEQIPKGPTGKLQRIGLADKLAAKLGHQFVSSKTEMERELADIWKDLLNVDRVGIRDNFYMIGGNSLATVSMITEVEERFNATIPMDSFLRSPTIETIARLLQDQEASIPHASGMAGLAQDSQAIEDSALVGLKNRLLQLTALYAPGYKTVRVWLHRMRGVSIGTNVSIGLSAIIETAYPRLVFIGNNVTIGMRALIIAHLRDLTTQARVDHQPTVRIEDNVYIGPGAIILPNVTIGHGAVVSAGSVVSSSIPPQTLVRGNPAQAIAHCGVSLGGGVPYEQFVRHLTPIQGHRSA
jgi:acyl-CoA synthetase (AMP-forming)/AMP-acid ligase II/acetyltransferase-like isoleucine patch superfamily enzyme/acyl carrier protein